MFRGSTIAPTNIGDNILLNVLLSLVKKVFWERELCRWFWVNSSSESSKKQQQKKHKNRYRCGREGKGCPTLILSCPWHYLISWHYRAFCVTFCPNKMAIFPNTIQTLESCVLSKFLKIQFNWFASYYTWTFTKYMCVSCFTEQLSPLHILMGMCYSTESYSQ